MGIWCPVFIGARTIGESKDNPKEFARVQLPGIGYQLSDMGVV